MQNLAKRQESQQITLTAKPLHARVKKKKKKTLNKIGKAKASKMFHYGDTPTCEGAIGFRQGRKPNTSSKVNPIE